MCVQALYECDHSVHINQQVLYQTNNIPLVYDPQTTSVKWPVVSLLVVGSTGSEGNGVLTSNIQQ